MENDFNNSAGRLTSSTVDQVECWQCLWDVLAIECARHPQACGLSRVIAGRWMRRYKGVVLVSSERGKRWVRVGVRDYHVHVYTL